MAGTYDVTVTQGAQSDTLAGAFEYYNPNIIGTFSPVNWFDLSQESYADAATVTRMTDRGSDGVDLVNASGTPTYNATDNAVIMDGVDDALQSETTTSTAVSQPHTLVVVAQVTTTDADQITIDADASAPTASRVTALDGFSGGGDSLGMWAGVLLDTTTALTQPMSVMFIEFNGGSSKFIEDGVTLVTGNAGTQGARGFTVGGRQNLAAGRFAGVKFRELGRIGRALTAQEITDMTSALKLKWGIS